MFSFLKLIVVNDGIYQASLTFSLFFPKFSIQVDLFRHFHSQACIFYPCGLPSYSLTFFVITQSCRLQYDVQSHVS